MNHSDKILSRLSSHLVDRKLYKIELQNTGFDTEYIERLKNKAIQQFSINKEDIEYIVFTDTVSNNAYNSHKDGINILYKNNEIKDISDASDQLNESFLSKSVLKYILCYPKELN